jgi:hypothetical protein
MSPSQARFFVPFTHFGFLLFLAGLLTGGVLFLLDVPIWAYYIAPLAGVPILLWGLLVEDRMEERESTAKQRVRKSFGAVHAYSVVVELAVLGARFSRPYRWELGWVRFLLVAILSIVIALGGISALTVLVRAFADGAFVPSLIAVITLGLINLAAFALRTRQAHRIRRHERDFGHSHQRS